MHKCFAVVGRNPFNQNFRKFQSKTQWISSVQPEKFWKNWSTFWGGPLFLVGPVWILVEWIAPLVFLLSHCISSLMTFSKTAPTCKRNIHLPSLTTVFLIRFFFLLSTGFLDFSSWTWFFGLTPRKLLQFLAPQWHFFFSFPDKIFRHIEKKILLLAVCSITGYTPVQTLWHLTINFTAVGQQVIKGSCPLLMTGLSLMVICSSSHNLHNLRLSRSVSLCSIIQRPETFHAPFAVAVKSLGLVQVLDLTADCLLTNTKGTLNLTNATIGWQEWDTKWKIQCCLC